MKRVRATVGAVLWALVVAANAHASDGRITFTGSVVTPTCAPAVIQTPAQNVPPHLRTRCPGTSVPTAYTLRLEPAAAALPGSQVIAYHDAYLRQAGTHSMLATQEYD
ncbi:hypothetical protein JI752_014200 [Lysobacter sp. MMG2]|uniref:hypothetical protein n=1 Tax=Lysobacter sp. MMG2 TaxID=2801338 RepID=UPI001C23973C|nr:hypothetical protein [Lysobacter sp. MMG2]MBU8977300.1 hypothetical protein [Lysobacter sp. MMG2]